VDTSEEALYDGDFVRTFDGACARAAVLNDAENASSFRTANRLLSKRADLLRKLSAKKEEAKL
jgi:hypothetical protein